MNISEKSFGKHQHSRKSRELELAAFLFFIFLFYFWLRNVSFETFLSNNEI